MIALSREPGNLDFKQNEIMEGLDNYQFREERVRRGGRRAIQSLNVTDRNTVDSDESAWTKHFVSV